MVSIDLSFKYHYHLLDLILRSATESDTHISAPFIREVSAAVFPFGREKVKPNFLALVKSNVAIYWRKNMCRIDAPFKDIHLNEKEDPVERFSQALDENDVKGEFRRFLEKHFSNNWEAKFHTIERLEEAIETTKDCTEDRFKIEMFTCFLFEEYIIQYAFDLKSYSEKNEFKHNTEKEIFIRELVKDIAQTFFPKSAYAFYQSKIGLHLRNYIYHINVYIFLYGSDLSLEHFFNTEVLTPYDKDLLERFALSISGDRNYIVSNYKTILSIIANEPEESTRCVIRALNFLKSWITYASKKGDIRILNIRYDVYAFWNCSKKLIESQIESLEGKEEKILIQSWLNDTDQELRKLYIFHFNLNHASEHEIEAWTEEINKYVTYDLDESLKKNNKESHTLVLTEYMLKFTSSLGENKIRTWIRSNIKKEINNSIYNSYTKEIYSYIEYFNAYNSIYMEILKSEFQTLPIKDRITILDQAWNFSNPLISNETRNDLLLLQKTLFIESITHPDVEEQHLPKWIQRLDLKNRAIEGNELIPYLDKSITISRKEMLIQNKEKDSNLFDYQEFQELLRKLEYYQENAKALKHRLLLIEQFTAPIADESLTVVFTNRLDLRWYKSFKDILKSYLFDEMSDEKKLEIATDFTKQIANFCLSRLKLRKGEKLDSAQYQDEQAIEPSQISRQGYLKALQELGFDLGGDAHKTINFTSKSDPNEAVRSIAKECYTHLRRQPKKNPSFNELIRGLIAAEWWILLSQREVMDEHIDYHKAKKTRRKLLKAI